MCEAPVRTKVLTAGGVRALQEYLIVDRGEPEVQGVELDGIATAEPSAEVLEVLRWAEAIVIGPSNPVISIGPILAVPGMTEAIAASEAPVVAVSPFVAGQVVKGPTERFMQALGRPSTAAGVTSLYAGLIDAMVVDEDDPDPPPAEIPTLATATLMEGAAGRARLARIVLDYAASCHRQVQVLIPRAKTEAAADAGRPNSGNYSADRGQRPAKVCSRGIGAWTCRLDHQPRRGLKATAVLPVKRFGAAKQRLAAGMGATHRAELAAAMLEDVLEAIGAARSIEHTVVVTSEPRAIALASEAGCELVADPEEGGHSGAALAGIARARELGAECVVLLPIDCPLLDPRELERLLTGMPERYVAIVPTGTGRAQTPSPSPRRRQSSPPSARAAAPATSPPRARLACPSASRSWRRWRLTWTRQPTSSP